MQFFNPISVCFEKYKKYFFFIFIMSQWLLKEMNTSAMFELKSSKSNSTQQNEYLTEVSYDVVIREYFFSKFCYPLLLLVAERSDFSHMSVVHTLVVYSHVHFNIDSERRHFVREAKIFSVGCRLLSKGNVSKFINIYSRNPICFSIKTLWVR